MLRLQYGRYVGLRMPTINSLVWAGRKRLERYAEVFPY